MLSSLTAADLRQAIAQAETRRLQAIPGVGRKTAERVVLELQDKMAALALTASGQPSLMVTADEQVMRDVISALLNLGYRQQRRKRAVRTARTKQDRQSDVGGAPERRLTSTGALSAVGIVVWQNVW